MAGYVVVLAVAVGPSPVYNADGIVLPPQSLERLSLLCLGFLDRLILNLLVQTLCFRSLDAPLAVQ